MLETNRTSARIAGPNDTWLERMNDEVRHAAHDSSDHGDVTGNTLITELTGVVSSAVSNSRYEQRRAKIRAELVREYFDKEHQIPPSLSKRLLKIFKLN